MQAHTQTSLQIDNATDENTAAAVPAAAASASASAAPPAAAADILEIIMLPITH